MTVLSTYCTIQHGFVFIFRRYKKFRTSFKWIQQFIDQANRHVTKRKEVEKSNVFNLLVCQIKSTRNTTSRRHHDLGCQNQQPLLGSQLCSYFLHLLNPTVPLASLPATDTWAKPLPKQMSVQRCNIPSSVLEAKSIILDVMTCSVCKVIQVGLGFSGRRGKRGEERGGGGKWRRGKQERERRIILQAKYLLIPTQQGSEANLQSQQNKAGQRETGHPWLRLCDRGHSFSGWRSGACLIDDPYYVAVFGLTEIPGDSGLAMLLPCLQPCLLKVWFPRGLGSLAAWAAVKVMEEGLAPHSGASLLRLGWLIALLMTRLWLEMSGWT